MPDGDRRQLARILEARASLGREAQLDRADGWPAISTGAVTTGRGDRTVHVADTAHPADPLLHGQHRIVDQVAHGVPHLQAGPGGRRERGRRAQVGAGPATRPLVGLTQRCGDLGSGLRALRLDQVLDTAASRPQGEGGEQLYRGQRDRDERQGKPRAE